MTKDNKVIFVVKQLEPEPIKIVRKDGAVTYKAVVIDSFSIETEGVVMRKGMELIWAWFIGKRYFQLNIDMNGTGRFYDWSYVPEASLPAYKSKYKCNQSKD
ncbi:hypothetical protein [Neptuniibacter sp.]|uniref:hypothetical protein n=1 Tax=Neptuniibacter sp. TaxID=1962643 RepID=UPI003B59A2F4